MEGVFSRTRKTDGGSIPSGGNAFPAQGVGRGIVVRRL